MSSGIYIIINQITNKCYIGQAYNINKRIQRHFQHLEHNYHHCSHLQRAWNKYGKASFVFYTLEIIENYEQLTPAEQFWMDSFKAFGAELYNTLPAKRTHLGIKRSQETKDKISKANKGKVRSSEVCQAMSKQRSGKKLKPHSEETKQKIAKANKGKKRSPERTKQCREQLEKTKELRKKRHLEALSMTWTIKCPDGTVVITNKLKQFCIDHGLHYSTLCEVLRHKRGIKQHRGYTSVDCEEK